MSSSQASQGAVATPSHVPGPHLVHFYESEAAFLDTVVAHLAAGLEEGAAAVAIMDPSRVQVLRKRLERPEWRGRTWILDARQALASFDRDSRLDEARFRDAIGAALAKAEAVSKGPVRAFGEMVAILQGQGRTDAAVQLEEFWNRLGASHSFWLLCAYPLRPLAGLAHDEAVQRIVEVHSRLLPPRKGAPGMDGDRALLELQRRDIALREEAEGRRVSEEALRRGGEDLNDLLENASEAIHQVDAEGKVLWANQAELDMLGYTREEYFGRSITDFHADADVIASILERLKRGEVLRDAPARLRAKDGSIRQVLIYSSGRFVDGKFVYSRCFTRDVTETLRRDEARRTYAQLVSSLNDGFVFLDAKWTILQAQLVPVLDDPERGADVVGKPFWEVFPHVRHTDFETVYRTAMAEQRPQAAECHFPPRNTWWEVRALPMDGGLWVYYRDITARRRAREHQAALAQLGRDALAARELDALLDGAVHLVHRTLSVDFCKLLALEPDGASFLLRAGVGWREGLVGTARIPAEGGSQAGYTLSQGQPVIVSDLPRETRFRGSDLLVQHRVQSGMTVVIGGPTRPYGVLGVHTAAPRDFDQDESHFLQAVAHLLAAAIERRRLEEHLEELVAQRTRRLAESNQELEAFNYSVSHDLRTPLRAISGFSGLLLQKHPADMSPAARRIVEQVRDEAKRMGTLIEGLLNLSRYHRMDIGRQEADLSRIAQEVVTQLAAAHPGHRVKCTIAPALHGRGDPALLRVVLENLVGNAWKFSQNAERPRIEVTGLRENGGTTIVVKDNGPGFDPAYAHKLFQPFQRLHSAHEFEGTGIGLATVARIVHRHGGHVRAESLGDGAAFSFFLPDEAPPEAPSYP